MTFTPDISSSPWTSYECHCSALILFGRKLKRALSVNQVLLSRHLEINWAIEKGQKILIQSNAGPVSVVSAGIARNSAQVGELLEAENQMSGTIVEGIVVSNKKIRILTK